MSDAYSAHIIHHMNHAISIVDATEPQIRDLIETKLMDTAGINRTKVSDAMLTRDDLVKQIYAIRSTALKQAFRHLRDNWPSDL